MSSFRRYGGLNFSANNSIIRSYISNSQKTNTTKYTGLENSKEVSACHIDMSGNSLLHTGTIYFQDGSSMSTATNIGPQGSQGYQGYQGYQGQTGTGSQGSQGYQGYQGYQGQTGTGSQGSQGYQGYQGYQGSQGYQGYQGYQGQIGQTGTNYWNSGIISNSIYYEDSVGIGTQPEQNTLLYLNPIEQSNVTTLSVYGTQFGDNDVVDIVTPQNNNYYFSFTNTGQLSYYNGSQGQNFWLIDPTGNAVFSTVSASSDYRIKKDIIPLSLNEYSVDKLKPVVFKFNEGNKLSIGLIAHELQEEYPFLVEGEKDGNQYQSVNYNGLIGILIKEIQELKERVKILENK